LKRKFLYLLLAFSFLFLASCASGSLSPENIEASAQAIVATGIPLTLTAWPTNTSLPTATPQPSSTTEASPSPAETQTESPTAISTFLPTWTPYGQSESGAFETAKADKADQNAPLLLNNRTDEEIQFTLLSPRYQEYQFTGNMTLILPEGQYSYRAKVGDKSFSGSFSITNGDKHVLTFYSDRIHFATP